MERAVVEQADAHDGSPAAIALESPRPRRTWRKRRLGALLIAAPAVALVGLVLGDTPDTELSATTSPKEPSPFLDDQADPDAAGGSTTTETTPAAHSPPLTPPTTIGDHPIDPSPPPSGDPLVDVPATHPGTTSTTADPHPWVENPLILDSSSERPQAGKEWVYSESVMGIVSVHSRDFGDGTSEQFRSADSATPWGCADGFAPGIVRHTWAAPGTYVVTVTIRGSGDCDTAPSSFADTIATLTVDVLP